MEIPTDHAAAIASFVAAPTKAWEPRARHKQQAAAAMGLHTSCTMWKTLLDKSMISLCRATQANDLTIFYQVVGFLSGQIYSCNFQGDPAAYGRGLRPLAQASSAWRGFLSYAMKYFETVHGSFRARQMY